LGFYGHLGALITITADALFGIIFLPLSLVELLVFKKKSFEFL
jgi:hypothetical protein